MSYTPPDLATPVVLTGGYTPPDLSTPVVLCQEAGGPDYVDGTLSASISTPFPSATFAAGEEPARSGETLWAKTLYRPADPTVSATTQSILPADLVAAADPIITEPLFRGRERGYFADLAVTTNPLIVDSALAGIAERIHAVHIDIPAPPLIVAPTITTSFSQILDLPDNQGPGLATQHVEMQRQASGLGLDHAQMQRIETPVISRQAQAGPIQVSSRWLAAQMLRMDRPIGMAHAHGVRIGGYTAVPHAEALRVRRPVRAEQAHGLPIEGGIGSGYADTLKRRTPLRLDHAEALARALGLPEQTAQALTTAHGWRVEYAQMLWPAPGRWWPWYEPPPLSKPIVLACGDYIPRPLECTVLLHWEPIAQPYCPGIDEPPPSPTIIVPIREVYIVINTFSLVRISDSAPIPATDFSADIDAESWTWGWSARVPGASQSLVTPPVDVLATVNGTPIHLLVERINRDRRFGESWLRIAGRGRAAHLAEPEAPVESRTNAQSRTAQQLVNDALTINGVSIGWNVDWQLVDWTVPAGVWSHTGTYIEAALRVAEAGGGYIQGHDTAQTLIIKPWYPTLPWNWGAAIPDISLPEDVCETESIEWVEKPGYNQVWIAGSEGGVLGNVKRAATAGDNPAPTIVDPLITEATAARNRGERILADTGKQARIRLRLPVLAETGIIKPGLLVEYSEQGVSHRGLTRGVSLQQSFPQLWQTVEIETHESV